MAAKAATVSKISAFLGMIEICSSKLESPTRGKFDENIFVGRRPRRPSGSEPLS
jgi:hypothetical protein